MMKTRLLAVLAFTFSTLMCAAHETHSESEAVELETEAFFGKRGYFHLGAGVSVPLNQRQTLGIVAHTVREETGEEQFPSAGVQFHQKLGNGFEFEAYSFGYFRVERQSAWAAGLRAIRRFALGTHLTATPFLAPVYAQVRALDEATESPVTVHHLMFVGGITVEAERLKVTVFGTQSAFNRDTTGLETHVDLQEMTQITAYENNDGFARNSVGAEVAYSPLEWLTLTGRYAAIFYEEETRHSAMVTPSVRIGSNVKVFAGVQWIRGEEVENDIGFGGMELSF